MAPCYPHFDVDLSAALHPSIYAKLDALERRMVQAANTGEVDADLQRVVERHREIWWDAYGTRYTRMMVAFVATTSVLLAGLLLAQMGHLIGMAFLTTVGIFGASAGFSLARNRREVVPAELRNLVDALELEPAERAYCEAMASLGENGLLPESQREAFAGRLGSLMQAYRSVQEHASGAEQGRLAGVIEQTLLRARAALAELDASDRRLEEASLDDLDAQLEEVVAQTEALDAALGPMPALTGATGD